MTYTKLIFIYRKQDVTVEQFISIYEHQQMPVLRQIAGNDFPSLHKRGYVHAPGGPLNPKIAYDCVAELTFVDEAHMLRYWDKLSQNKEALRAVEETFMDTAKTTGVDLGAMYETRAQEVVS